MITTRAVEIIMFDIMIVTMPSAFQSSKNGRCGSFISIMHQAMIFQDFLNKKNKNQFFQFEVNCSTIFFLGT